MDRVQHVYEVLVGNVGTVYRGNNGHLARKDYTAYKRLSKAGAGRAAGEPVTLLKDGEVEKAHLYDRGT